MPGQDPDRLAIVDDERGLFAIVDCPTIREYDAFHATWAKASDERGGALAWQALESDPPHAHLVERGLRRVNAEYFHPAFRRYQVGERSREDLAPVTIGDGPGGGSWLRPRKCYS